MSKIRTGIIGGTGLYSLDGVEILEKVEVETPFGRPSSPLTIGRLGKNEVVFLPRHGLHHQILPSEINYRANIWALKTVGVRQIVSVSATGSLEKEIAPGDLAIPDQYLDWTKGKRAHTFFGDGLVAHISTAKPACARLSEALIETGRTVDVKIHSKKSYACVEGPRLGTRTESFFLRGNGCQLVGMTNIPEVFLAREAQICYCTLAIATDYDCWMDDEEPVTVDLVIERYKKTLGQVLRVLSSYFEKDRTDIFCSCRESLKHAIMTPVEHMGKPQRERLDFLKF